MLFLVPITLSLSSCGRNNVALATVQEFAGLATQAAEQFPNIANDLYASCVRTAEYRYPIRLDGSLDGSSAPKPSSSPPDSHRQPVEASPQPQSSGALTNVFEQRGQDLQRCESPRAIANELLSNHAALVNYLVALGQLAADERVNFNRLNTLQSALQNSSIPLARRIGQIGATPIPGSTDIQPGGFRLLDILQTVLREFANRSRLETIKQVVISTDREVTNLTQNLTEVLNRGYLGYLTSEERAIDGYYGTYVNGLLNHRTEGDTQTLTASVIDLDTRWRSDREAIRQKRQAASNYVELLNAIAIEHHRLALQFQGGDTPSHAELDQMIENYIVELRKTIHTLQVAYATRDE